MTEKRKKEKKNRTSSSYRYPSAVNCISQREKETGRSAAEKSLYSSFVLFYEVDKPIAYFVLCNLLLLEARSVPIL